MNSKVIITTPAAIIKWLRKIEDAAPMVVVGTVVETTSVVVVVVVDITLVDIS